MYQCYLLYVFIAISHELWEQIISHFYLKYYQLVPKSLIEKCKKNLWWLFQVSWSVWLIDIHCSGTLCLVAWFNIIITLFREILYGIYFNIRCIFWYFPWILNLRPLKAKLGALHLFGTFWQFLAIFAFLAELDNSKHFEPYLFFWPLWPFLALRPLWPSKAKISGLFRDNYASSIT